VSRLRTPSQVQSYLNRLPYNYERTGNSLRSFRSVVRHGSAHCLEAALFAATVLEYHGYPPLVISFESIDKLDHVIFVYKLDGRWGSIARSRDPGLHGRRPVFPSTRALAASYMDTYVDFTGRVGDDLGPFVRGEVADGDPQCADLGGNRFAARAVPAMHDHRAAFPGEHSGNTLADTGIAAGHQGSLAAQLQIHRRAPIGVVSGFDLRG